MEDKKYCVYRHKRLDTNEIFYVGIGNKERPYKKYKSNRSKYWHNIVNKTKYEVEILFFNLDIETAKELEIFLIQLYGRKDLKTGNLVNMTDGGDGCLNLKHSLESRKKQGLARKNKPLSKKHAESLRNSNIGRITSQETKNKISKNSKKKFIPIGVVKKRKIINIITNKIYSSMQECSRIENINYSTLQRCIKSNSKMFKQFKILTNE
jgi:hypothetical protein